MRCMKLLRLVSSAAVVAVSAWGTPVPVLARPPVSTIEAIPGKRYELTKAHGPVMIMVETFRKSANEEADPNAKTAEQVANELVFELRKKHGIPAYICHVDGQDEMIETTDRRGERDRKKNLRKVESFGVIAGNYPSMKDPLAKDTLVWMKKFKPDCLAPDKGIVWYAKAGQGPFQKAFLTVNPLLKPEEVEERMQGADSFDPLLVRLNSAVNYSLLENKGKYTLQVAMFSGRKVVEGSLAAQKTNFFEAKGESPLDLVAIDANDLTLALRQHRKQEAYVWHDHYNSIVTVGSYQTKDDPRIAKDMELYRAKLKPNLETKVDEVQPELLWINNTGPNKNVTRMWAFMPEPILIPVPKMTPKPGPLARLPEAMKVTR